MLAAVGLPLTCSTPQPERSFLAPSRNHFTSVIILYAIYLYDVCYAAPTLKNVLYRD